MALIGRLHPLLIHFPIALAIAAAAAEMVGSRTRDLRWRIAAIWNIRTAAAFALAATLAGWRLAAEPGTGATGLLEWHRWLGAAAAAVMLVAAAATFVSETRGPRVRIYQIAMYVAGALVAVAAHVGAALVWGADFLRP
jgi:uncharacterized membrane protein